MIFAAGVGIPLGRYAARHAQGWSDGAVTVVSLLGISIPVFVLGLTLQYIFAVQLDLLPAAGRIDPRANLEIKSNFVLIDSLLMGRPDLFLDGLSHLILPAIALGSIPLAIICRITRASVLDVTNEDYVRTARAKGLGERKINARHIMRNAWLPVVTSSVCRSAASSRERSSPRRSSRGAASGGTSWMASATATTSSSRARSWSSPWCSSS